MTTLWDIYQNKIEKGYLNKDASQARAVQALSDFAQDKLGLDADKQQRALALVGRALGWSRAGRNTQDLRSGFYFYGPVGRGKTMAMDLLFTHAPLQKKRRVHFHAFMLEVHDFLHDMRQKKTDGIDSALLAFADRVAKDVRLLCFDEFFVKDVADAMILGRLFTALFERGVYVIMTSNVRPDNLYEDGLQRDRFLPFIALLKQRLRVMTFDGDIDYRLNRIRDMQAYFWPHDDDAHAQMQKAFDAVADGEPVHPAEISVKGRTLHVPRATKEICWFTFAQLCEDNKSALDYLTLARHYKAVVIANVPRFDDRRRDVMTRFVHLIDALYDNHIQIIMSAAAAPDALYTGAEPTVFARTASRLEEMQSRQYRSQYDAA